MAYASKRGKRIQFTQGCGIALCTSAFISQSVWMAFPSIVQNTACMAG